MLFGFQTQFGGGRSTGFCLIYDHKDFMSKIEPSYRLRRNKLLEPKAPTNRRSKKELKNKKKKFRGKAKTAATLTKKGR
jgi:small subunit ribosomal protein S24e